MMRAQLGINAVPLQLPIGLEGDHEGVVDIVNREAFQFDGEKGDKVTKIPIPENLVDDCEKARGSLIENLADVDDEIGELYLMEEEPTSEQVCTGFNL